MKGCLRSQDVERIGGAGALAGGRQRSGAGSGSSSRLDGGSCGAQGGRGLLAHGLTSDHPVARVLRAAPYWHCFLLPVVVGEAP